MSTNAFEFSVFIGRFQPFHLAHYELVKEAL
jgi:nicotinamide mononucleotide adenylyltransferase